MSNSNLINLISSKSKIINYNTVENDLNINHKNLIELLDYISLIKIIAVFSVIILHTNGEVFWKIKYNFKTYQIYLFSSNLIECIFFFGVPFFVLSIGATLLDFNHKYDLIQYYKKRIKKVIFPLISWNIILYFFRVHILKNMKKIKFNFNNLWNLYYGHHIYPIFGSLHDFIFIYMIIPTFAYIEKSKKIKIYSYFFIFLFITQSLIPYLINVFNLNLIWIYNFNPGLIIYVFAGYIIQNHKFHIFSKIIIYLLGIFGFMIHLFGTYNLIKKYKTIINLHKGYYNLPCILYATSCFLFIKEYSYLFFKIVNKKYINKIGRYTFGPFFMHLPLINLYSKYFKVNKLTLKYQLFDGFIICCILIFLTSLMARIPLIKYLVP